MNLLARRQENLPGTPLARHSAVDELFNRILHLWMQAEGFPEPFGMDQGFEIGEKEISLQLPCPGKKKENIDVEITGDLLTVKSCFCDTGGKESGKEKERSCIFSERCSSMCVGSFRIPVRVIGREARAHYCDGMLTITIPRDLSRNTSAQPVKVICE